MNKNPPPLWLQQNGQPLSCREKLKVLNENYQELSVMVDDVWQDALVMGCSPQSVKNILHALIDEISIS